LGLQRLKLSLDRPQPAAGEALPQLDALRGVAILSVFVQHLGDRFEPLVRQDLEKSAPPTIAAWILTIIHHAWWGVDLFFVLSGFSLALSWLRGGGQRTSMFFLRRAARILPGYYVALAVTIAIHHFIVFERGFVPSVLVHLLVLQGYFSPGGIVIIGAAWSLTTEACFYIAFPWLARLVLPKERRALFAAIAIVVLSWISRGVLHHLVLEPGVVTGALEMTQRRIISSRLDQFVLGMLAARAFVFLEPQERASKIAPFALLVAAPLLVVAFKLEGAFFLDPFGSFPYALLSLVTASIVLASCLCRGRALALITPRPLVFTGVVSYGVFLYHQIAIGLSDLERSLPPTWKNLARTSIFALAASLFAGYLSWALVERPVLRWASRRAKRQANAAALQG